MEPILYTYTANQNDLSLTIFVSLGLALPAIVGMIWLLRKSTSGDNNRRLLIAMLLFFVGIIGGGTAFFSWLTTRKLGPVTLTASTITTPYGQAPYSQIREAYLKNDPQGSWLDPTGNSRQIRLLFLIEDTGKTHVLSEKNYPVSEILAKMRSLTTTTVPK